MDKSFGAKFVDLLFKNGQILGLFFAFLVIGGAIAFATSVPKGFPEVNINVAFITAPYPGATANQVETQVIRPIEQVVADIKSITEYSSVASDSFGSITVTFDEGADYRNH
ncbi:MAG: efflux RND transporter permease subunit [Patescibacteria group bacterium]